MSAAPALNNFSPGWQKLLQQLRCDIVLVIFAAPPLGPIWSHPQIGESLGAELTQAGAGQHDSSGLNDGSQFHFFHVSDLGKAVGVLKHQIQIRGLLPFTHLLHRELPNAWRCYWSAEEKEIAQLVEDDAP